MQECAHVECVVPGYNRTGTVPPSFRYFCAQCDTLTPRRPGGRRKLTGVPATPAPLTPAMATPHRHHPAFSARGAGARHTGVSNGTWAAHGRLDRVERTEPRRNRPLSGARPRALFVDEGDWSEHHGPQRGRGHDVYEAVTSGRQRKERQTEVRFPGLLVWQARW
jgi:hypothetical protein